MASVHRRIALIAARCRRVGWEVEAGDNSDWVWRITTPKGRRVQLHGSPSDVNWERTVMRQLEADGLTAAEEEAREARRVESARKEKAAAERAAERAAKLARESEAVARAAGPLGIAPIDIDWALAPTEVMQTRCVLMTPEAATKLLDANPRNRRITTSSLDYFVNEIDGGRFKLTHQGMAIDNEGLVQDGQTRLKAIEQTGKTVPVMFTVGAPVDNFKVIDVGRPRQARDLAYIRGEKHETVFMSAARLILLYDLHGPSMHKVRRRLSIGTIDEAAQRAGDELRHMVATALRVRLGIRRTVGVLAGNPSGLAAGLYIIARQLPRDDARLASFIEDLIEGECDKADPVANLRRMMVRAHSDHRAYDAMATMAYLFKAWNQRATGKTTRYMAWSVGDSMPAPILPPPVEADQ